MALGVLFFNTSCAPTSKSTSGESTSTALPAPPTGAATAAKEGLAADGVTVAPDPSWCGRVVHYLDVPTDSSSEDSHDVLKAEREAALDRAQGAADTPECRRISPRTSRT